ncbi:hypothetical protein Bbelb_151580 [Branchiostoma belcheri]|nr:hypothetical protein Bbelb_151580 [Branchiostoma belcheri]
MAFSTKDRSVYVQLVYMDGVQHQGQELWYGPIDPVQSSCVRTLQCGVSLFGIFLQLLAKYAFLDGESLDKNSQTMASARVSWREGVEKRLVVLTNMTMSSGDSCLNLTTVDWTRPGDLKIQEEYQLTAVMILNPTRPDVRVLRNLVTGNFSPVQTSKSDDLKTVRETCDDQRLLSKPDQMRAEKTVDCVLRVCQLCRCSCPDEMRPARVMTAEAPGDTYMSIRRLLYKPDKGSLREMKAFNKCEPGDRNEQEEEADLISRAV